MGLSYTAIENKFFAGPAALLQSIDACADPLCRGERIGDDLQVEIGKTKDRLAHSETSADVDRRVTITGAKKGGGGSHDGGADQAPHRGYPASGGGPHKSRETFTP